MGMRVHGQPIIIMLTCMHPIDVAACSRIGARYLCLHPSDVSCDLPLSFGRPGACPALLPLTSALVCIIYAWECEHLICVARFCDSLFCWQLAGESAGSLKLVSRKPEDQVLGDIVKLWQYHLPP